jgi:ABC-2 type transport system permease protein
MSYRQIARKDFEDAVRSGMFWGIIGISLLLLVVVAFGIATDDLDGVGEEVIYVLYSQLGADLVIPVMGLVFGYLAVAGERQSGSLRILFGLSNNRRDVVLGKVLSRTALIVIGMIVSVTVVFGLVVALFDSFDVGTFLAFAGLTTLLAMAFTGIAVGISSTTGTRGRAMGGAIGTYVAFQILWYPFVAIIHYAVEGELAGVEAPDWYLLLLALNPIEAYRNSLGQVIEQHLFGMIWWPNIVEEIPQEALAQDDSLLLANRAAGDAPFYLSEWFGVVVLLAWFAFPIALGYWRFQNADLN